MYVPMYVSLRHTMHISEASICYAPGNTLGSEVHKNKTKQLVLVELAF